MPSRPRLVATDLDGTLLRSDGTVSPATAETLDAIELAGVDVVFVTGRPPRWMTALADGVGAHGVAVCSNGALIVDLKNAEILRSRLLEPPLLAEVVGTIRRELPHVFFGVEYGWDFAAEPGYRATEVAATLASTADVVARPVAKLLVKDRGGDADGLLAELTELVGELVTCTHSGLGSGLAEISAAGVTKASGLAELCAERGIQAADVAAFGDMPNDLPMLAWAGRPYAVANAHPDVLAAVPGRAPANDDDGVARTLRELFGL
ncbi:MAG: HAD family phosphatase [Streptosporangiales bacterium]|nr:HAD family phosphatase [Streptosporangiales bacterium]MBO0889899.1 HAD family phosphatase [Acidothermales bacterium]